MVYSSIGIAILSFLVWGHHMFVSGQSVYAGTVFSFLTMFIAVPSAVKVFNWMATLFKGSVSYDTPMLYALGFIGLFVIGGMTGLMLATMGLDIHVHDTYFVVSPLPLCHGGGDDHRATWVGCTTGGRRSPGVCIRDSGRSCRR